MIYITGSSGFIGKSVIKELKKKNIQYRKIKIRQKVNQNSLNFKKKNNISKNNILIHLGWGKMEDPWSNFHLNNNYINSINLFKISKNNFFEKVIFCGSMNEYGNKYGPLKEDMKSGKLETLYAKSKFKVTQYGLKFFKNSQTKFYCIRPSYVFGANQRKGTLIDLLVRSHKKKKYLNMTKCKHQRDYIYVEEVAKGIVKFAKIKKNIESGIYNIGSGRCVTIKNFIISLCKIIKFEKKFLKFGTIPEKKEQKQLKSYLVCSKVKKNFNWEPEKDINVGLRKMAKIIL